MFEELKRQLKEMEHMQISIPIEPDEKGYIDKQCPSKECEFLFKVNADDWKNLFRDEAVWCPLCGHRAKADQWFTHEQVKHAREEGITIAGGRIHNALKAGAERFNRRQPKGGLISISMKVQGGMSRTYALPAPAAESMQLEIRCEACSAHFAVIGSAYFCPACGHNSVTRMFSDSLRKIEAKKDNVEIVRKALVDAGKRDEAELTCRSLIESCIQDGVVAFQKYCDELYRPFASQKEPPFNAFQRLQQGSELWRSIIGHGYDDWLSPVELRNLEVLYQKRHLLAHNEGIVDEDYVRRSGDLSYKVGQRIVIRTLDVDVLLKCLRKLSGSLKTAIDKQTP